MSELGEKGIEATFTTVSTDGQTIKLIGDFNVSVDGMVAGDQIDINRSWDDGATWWLYGTITDNLPRRGYEGEGNTIYQMDCAALAAAGPVNVRLSR